MAADQVQAVLDRALADVAGARSTSDLEQVRVRVLGRSGELTGLLRALGGIPASERPRVGQEANRAKGKVEAAIAERQEALRAVEHRRSLDASTLDLTLPGRYIPPGPVHLITRVMDEIIECPKHNGRFDYRTGAARGAPVCVNLNTYPVKVEGDDVLVEI